MAKRKWKPLSQEEFDLLPLSNWQIDEVPQEHWGKIPGLERREDTVSIMASGCCSDPKQMHDMQVVAGMDVIVHERNPKLEKGEGEGNAYHYVIQKIDDTRCPYIINGPFRCGTIIPHWFDAPDLEAYWSDPVE